MTLERVGSRPGEQRLVTCPFCGADLSEGHPKRRRAADHLEKCEAFHDAWGHDARRA